MTTMTPEQIVAANKANIETLVGLTNKAVAGVEQLIELKLAATKAAMEDTHTHTNAALSIKDSQELLALQASIFQPFAEKVTNYNRHLYEIASGTSADFSHLVESKIAEAQETFHTMFDNMAKNAPAGSEPAVTAFKTALANGNQALEQVQKAVKQATDLAEANFKTMANTALNAAQSVSSVTPAAKPSKKRAS